MIDTSVDYALNPKTSITVYVDLAPGGKGVDAIFDDDGAGLVDLELTRRFSSPPRLARCSPGLLTSREAISFAQESCNA